MDYKKLIKALLCDGQDVGQDKDGCTNKRCKYRDSDGACNIVRMCEDAATAISELLTRVETAESKLDRILAEEEQTAISAFQEHEQWLLHRFQKGE